LFVPYPDGEENREEGVGEKEELIGKREELGKIGK